MSDILQRQQLFRELVSAAYGGMYGRGPMESLDCAKIEGCDASTIGEVVTADEWKQIQGEPSVETKLRTTKLIHDVLAHPLVKIPFKMALKAVPEDPDNPDSRTENVAYIFVDLEQVSVEQLRQAGVVMAGFAAAKRLMQFLGETTNADEARVALKVIAENLGLDQEVEKWADRTRAPTASQPSLNK